MKVEELLTVKERHTYAPKFRCDGKLLLETIKINDKDVEFPSIHFQNISKFHCMVEDQLFSLSKK